MIFSRLGGLTQDLWVRPLLSPLLFIYAFERGEGKGTEIERENAWEKEDKKDTEKDTCIAEERRKKGNQ